MPNTILYNIYFTTLFSFLIHSYTCFKIYLGYYISVLVLRTFYHIFQCGQGETVFYFFYLFFNVAPQLLYRCSSRRSSSKDHHLSGFPMTRPTPAFLSLGPPPVLHDTPDSAANEAYDEGSTRYQHNRHECATI